MTAVHTQKENPIGPERGTTDVFLTAADFISEKSDQELLQEIETFDTDKAEMIYLYIPGLRLFVYFAPFPALCAFTLRSKLLVQPV